MFAFYSSLFAPTPQTAVGDQLFFRHAYARLFLFAGA
jgi:hypothetical protein